MSKKVLLASLAAIMVLAISLTGCAKTAEEKIVDAIQNMAENIEEAEQEADKDSASELEEDAQDASEQENQDAPTGKTPAESYERYLEAKEIGFEALTEKMETNAELAMTGSMELLAMAMIDLQAVPLTLITEDLQASETAGQMLGMQGLKITQSGENFSATYSGADQQVIALEGKYDAGTDSLSCVWSEDGAETLIVEYVMYESGYAGQYIITNDDGSITVMKVIVDGEDIGVGMGEASSKPDSIYKAAPSDFSFVSGLASMYALQDGVGTGNISGEEMIF